jgi:Tol biopolymer transport system component
MEDGIMRIRRIGVILAVWLLAVLAGVLVAGQKADQAEVQLKAAMHKELVDGDLKGAIELYQKVIAGFGGNRTVVARALVQMGQCYERMGQKEARSAYERVLREFADQSEPSRVARQRLAALQPPSAPPAPAAIPEMTVRRVWTTHGVLATSAGAPSPDGRYLPYYDGEVGDLRIHDFTTGQSRRLFVKKGDWSNDDEEATDPVFAPDGRRIAYTWFNKTFYELRVVEIDGSEPRVIYSNKDNYPTPYAWSPDATSLLCTLRGADGNRQIALVSVPEGSLRTLKTLGKDTPRGLAFSPDGRYAAYDRRAGDASPQRDVFTLEVATAREIPLIEHGADDQLLAWAPDGQRVLFSSDRTGTRDAWAIDVSAGVARGTPTLIKKNLGAVQPLGFSRTGVFYYRIPGFSREVYAATIDPATGKVLDPPRPAPRHSAGMNNNPDWSWDGQFLAYTSMPRPQNERFIVFQSARTGEERDLKLVMKDATPRFSLRWAPDGRSVLIETMHGADACGLTQVDVQTGAAAPLVQVGNCDLTGFGYMPDGKAIFYTRFDPATSMHMLMSRDLATGRETELGRHYMRFPVLSPDGRWIAFLGYSKTAKTYPLNVIPATGGATREVCSFPATGPRGVAWTPDGKYLYVGNLRNRKAELWRVLTAGGEPERLDIQVDGMWQFRLHPDGRRLAFEKWENNEEVWAIENLLPRQDLKPSGLAVRRILEVESGVDGTIDAGAAFFSFTDWETGDLAICELPSGNKRRLTNKGPWTASPEFTQYSVPSPDGRHVAYDGMTKDGRFELRVVGLDGSEPKVIHDGKGIDMAHPCGWSPDGTQVLAVLSSEKDRTSQVALLSVKDASRRAVATATDALAGRLPVGVTTGVRAFRRAALSPDGRYIAFDQRSQGSVYSHDIFVVASDGSRRTPLVQHAADDILLGWSPDGKHILFSSDRTGTADAWLLGVAEGRPQGAPQLVKKDLGRVSPMGFARDGSFYYNLGIGGFDVYVATVDTASGKVLNPPRLVPDRFLGSNTAPDWSPDGKQLFYLSRRGPIGPRFNIPTVRSMETGEERELTTGLLFLNQIRLSPDGRSLLGVCIDRAEKRGLCRIDVQTGQSTLLFESAPGTSNLVPAGVPDGTHILFFHASNEGQTVRIRNLGTGEERDVVRVGSYRFGVSRDGRHVAFQVMDPATKESIVKIVPVAGGEPREVFRTKSSGSAAGPPLLWLSWTADGRHVLVSDSGDDLFLVPVDGGKPLTFTLGMKGVLSPRLHPDGRQVAFFTESEARTEVWVMENFVPAPKAPR